MSAQPASSPRFARFLTRALVYLLLGAYFVLGFAYLGLRYYAWPRLDDWRPMLLAELSAAAGRTVMIGHLDAGFEGLRPRITVKDLRIDDDDGTAALLVPRATAVVSLAGILSGELRMSVLQFDAPMLRVERLDERRLRVAGIEVPMDSADDGEAVRRLIGQRRIVLHDATFEWIDRQRGVRNRMEKVELAIGSVGRRHRGALTIGSSGPGWRRLHAAIEIYREPGSAPLQWRRWTGSAYVGIDGFDAAPAAEFVELPVPLASASGDVKAWLNFGAGRTQDLRIKLAARGVEWRTADGPVHLAELRTDLEARQSAQGYRLSATQFELADASGFSLRALGEIGLVLDAQGVARSGRMSFEAFDPARALAFARTLPLAPDVVERLDELTMTGTVSALSASWTNEARLDFDVAVDFDELSVIYGDGNTGAASADPAGASQPVKGAEGAGPRPRTPWFRNLSGEARITRETGQLRIRSNQATLGFPGVFADAALPFDVLQAEANWKVERDAEKPGVAIEIGELRFANADVAGVVNGSFRTGGKGPGIVDLKGSMERLQANRVARYLPLQIPESVRGWAQNAIIAGRSDDTRFRLRGDLRDFPFRDPASGEFSITGGVHDGVLRYAPGWPQIDDFQGGLAFEREGMRIRMLSGRVFGVALGTTEAVLSDFQTPLLRVEGSGQGPASDMLRFVDESPLATRIQDFSHDTVVRGDATLQLRLDLPLERIDELKVAGTVRFPGNELRLDRTLPALTDVKGALEFTEQGLALRAMSATFLGGPLKVEGETPEHGRFILRGEGRISAQGMRQVVDNRLTQALEGSTAYRARIDVRHRASEVLLESDLVGLSSSLPAPLNKPAAASWPLRVRAIPEVPADPEARPGRDEMRVELRDAVRLVLQRERDPATARMEIRRGALAVNAEPVMQQAGLSVLLNTAEVDVDAWRPLLARGDPGAAEASQAGGRVDAGHEEGFSLVPNSVSVVADLVRVEGKLLHKVVFGASRVGGFWRANVSASEVHGFFSWREPGPEQRLGKLTARLTRLEIPRSRVGEIETLFEAPPAQLPGLDITVDDFVLFGRKLGRLELTATNGADAARHQWSLDAVRITNPAAEFRASGSWAQGTTGGVRPTKLDFELTVANSGELLGIYGSPGLVRGGSGSIAGTLHWIGSPLAVDYPSLGGEFSLKIGKGQFLKTDPGIGKLVGVLSLQSLPRRLTLDFRDIFSEGFSFDEIVGDVAITHGVARTDNLVMRGVQALVRIRGTADVEKETQDLAVEVRPEFNAGLASLAYGAMVNPVIGLGTFVAQLALKGQLQEFFSYEYDVTGSWVDPQVVEKRRPVVPTPTVTQ